MSLDERTGKASEDDKPISDKSKFKSLADLFVTEASSFLISLFKRENQELNSVILICIRI
jgi:hypothetical protein